MSSSVLATNRTWISATWIGASMLVLAVMCSIPCTAATQAQKNAAGHEGAPPPVTASRPNNKQGTRGAAPVAPAVPGTAGSSTAGTSAPQAGGASSSGGTAADAGSAQEKMGDQPPNDNAKAADAAQAAKDQQDEVAANLEKDENLLKLLTPEQRKLLDSGQKIPSPTGVFAEYPWLLPAIAVLLSLVAAIYVMEIRRRATRQIERARSSMNDLRNQLSEAEQELLARSTPVASSSLVERGVSRGAVKTVTGRAASRTSSINDDSAPANRGVMRAVESHEPAEDARRASYPSERESKGIPPATAARPASAQVTPDPRKATGDIVADYNKARSMGDDGAEWFKENYTWFSLSCTNFNDRVLNPNSVLLFQEESRGSFLGVTHRGETRLVPAFHNELEVSSSFLAGIFDYPPQTNGPLVLFRAATVEKSGSLWQLRQSGEIKLER